MARQEHKLFGRTYSDECAKNFRIKFLHVYESEISLILRNESVAFSRSLIKQIGKELCGFLFVGRLFCSRLAASLLARTIRHVFFERGHGVAESRSIYIAQNMPRQDPLNWTSIVW